MIEFESGNICFAGMSSEDLVLQVRPAQVVFEEFSKLRAQGKATPMVGPWNTVREGR